MQEEVENRTVNLAISTTKLTFRTIVNVYNAWKRHHQAKVAQENSAAAGWKAEHQRTDRSESGSQQYPH